MIKDEVIEELFEEEYSNESFINLALRLADSRDISNLGDVIRKLYDYTRSLPSPDDWLSEKKELFLSCFLPRDLSDFFSPSNHFFPAFCPLMPLQNDTKVL